MEKTKKTTAKTVKKTVVKKLATDKKNTASKRPVIKAVDKLTEVVAEAQNTVKAIKDMAIPGIGKVAVALGFLSKQPDGQLPILDYDEATLEFVERDATGLQKKFNLGPATIYQTQRGFHVFFYADRLTTIEYFDLLGMASCCEEFRKIGEKLGYTILRIAGKYDKNDIQFVKILDTNARVVKQEEKEEGDAKKWFLEALRTEMGEGSLGEGLEPLSEPAKITVDAPKAQAVAVNDEVTETKNETISAVTVKEEVKSVPGVNRPYAKSEIQAQAAAIFGDDAVEEIMSSLPEVSTQVQMVKVAKKIVDLVPPPSEAMKEWYRLPQVRFHMQLDAFNREVGFISENSTTGARIRPVKLLTYDAFSYWTNSFLNKKPYKMYRSLALYDTNMWCLPSLKKAPDADDEDTIFTALKDYADTEDKINSPFSKLLRESWLGADFILDYDEAATYADVKRVRDLLNAHHVPFIINYSGEKGWHIRIPYDCMFALDGDWTYDTWVVTMQKIAEKITKITGAQHDEKLYSGSKRVQIRILYSPHARTGNVCLPLTDVEFDRVGQLNPQTPNDFAAIFNSAKIWSGKSPIGQVKFKLGVSPEGEMLNRGLLCRPGDGNDVYNFYQWLMQQ